MTNLAALVGELHEWAESDLALRRRYADALDESRNRRDALLIRAREAGLTNRQIAGALSFTPESEAPGPLVSPYLVTPQRVTLWMVEADANLRSQALAFVADTLDDLQP